VAFIVVVPGHRPGPPDFTSMAVTAIELSVFDQLPIIDWNEYAQFTVPTGVQTRTIALYVLRVTTLPSPLILIVYGRLVAVLAGQAMPELEVPPKQLSGDTDPAATFPAGGFDVTVMPIVKAAQVTSVPKVTTVPALRASPTATFGPHGDPSGRS